MSMVNQLSDSDAGELLSRDTDQLYTLLGMRVKAVEEDISTQASFAPHITYSEHMGLIEELTKIGRRMFDKVHVQTFDLVCGSDPEEKEDRDKILSAVGISAEAAVTALSGALVTTFGIAAAFAAVLAALIIKRFALPALEEGHKGICSLWQEYLPARAVK